MTATATRPTFAEAVDVVDRLSAEEQEELIEIVRRRLVEAGRERVERDVAEGRAEFAAGRLTAMSVEEIMRRAKA